MPLRRPLVVRHGGTSLHLKSLRRAARDPARAAGFLALMHDAYPMGPDFDRLPDVTPTDPSPAPTVAS